MKRASPLDWLMQWYESQCDGEWEHGFGPSINTIDNPGWRLKIDLAGTGWDGRTLERINHNYEHETQWWTCWVEDNHFHGAGGPLQLGVMIDAFKSWTEVSLPRP